jgi:hypothetical protein
VLPQTQGDYQVRGGPMPEMVKPGPVILGDWYVMYPLSVANNCSELDHKRYLL